MEYILTETCQSRKKCKDGKSRNFLLYFLNGEQILKIKRPFEEKAEYDLSGVWHFKNTYILNNNLHQTRMSHEKERHVKFPLSKNKLGKHNIPKDFKIELVDYER